MHLEAHTWQTKKLKSADRLKTLQLLASLAPDQSTSENLVSTSSLGQYPEQGRSAKERDDLREDRLVRRGIDRLQQRFGDGGDASDGEGSEVSERERPGPAVTSKSASLDGAKRRKKSKKSKQVSWNCHHLFSKTC